MGRIPVLDLGDDDVVEPALLLLGQACTDGCQLGTHRPRRAVAEHGLLDSLVEVVETAPGQPRAVGVVEDRVVVVGGDDGDAQVGRQVGEGVGGDAVQPRPAEVDGGAAEVDGPGPAADPIAGLEDGDADAILLQAAGGSEPCGAGADDEHRAALVCLQHLSRSAEPGLVGPVDGRREVLVRRLAGDEHPVVDGSGQVPPEAGGGPGRQVRVGAPGERIGTPAGDPPIDRVGDRPRGRRSRGSGAGCASEAEQQPRGTGSGEEAAPGQHGCIMLGPACGPAPGRRLPGCRPVPRSRG